MLDAGQASAGQPSGGASSGPPPHSGPPDRPPVSTGGARTNEPTPTQPPPCEEVTLTIDELRPTVTLLVDQSGSMRFGFPERSSEQTRWAVVRQALLDPGSGVVPNLQQSIQFGIVFYTSRNGFSSGTCPILSEVRSATNNYEAIRKLYDETFPDDDTPTGPAIQEVVKSIQAAGRQGPEVMLLVTDGDPDTCEQPDPEDGQPQAIAGATAAYAAGIDFYVLGVSSDISGDKLQQLANAGQGKPLDAVFGVTPDAAEPFQASASVEGLSLQLRDILARVPLCEVALSRSVGLGEVSQGEVSLDGELLSLGNPDGFRLKDQNHLEVVGKGCERLRQSGKQLSVRISCP